MAEPGTLQSPNMRQTIQFNQRWNSLQEKDPFPVSSIADDSADNRAENVGDGKRRTHHRRVRPEQPRRANVDNGDEDDGEDAGASNSLERPKDYPTSRVSDTPGREVRAASYKCVKLMEGVAAQRPEKMPNHARENRSTYF